MKVAIASFTANGENIAHKIAELFNFEFNFYDKKAESARSFIDREFKLNNAIIFIGAVGIAVRLIAGHVYSKESDPAVIVIDEKGKYVIPVLSGHIGGGNALAGKLAEALNAEAVISTATDLNNCFAVDVWAVENNCAILDSAKIKYVSAALLSGNKVGWLSDFQIDGPLPANVQLDYSGDTGVVLSLDISKRPYANTLNLMPRIMTLGVGCKKNTNVSEFEEFVISTLTKYNFSLKAVRLIASIDLKANEECITAFANKYSLPFETYSGPTLADVPGSFHGSSFVKSVTGVDNVCERAAVLGSLGKLLRPKTSSNGMTLAIAATDWKGHFKTS